MKSAIAGTTLLALAAAQGPPGGPPGGAIGPFASFPSCASSCWSSLASKCSSITDYDCLCGAANVNTANACLAKSSCTSSEQDQVYQAVDQLCANVGVTIQASPEATWSATSGGSAWPTGWTTSAWPSGGPWGPGNGPPGWNPSGGWGPFGKSGPGNGWGPWGSSGAWTKGPWTSWWGTGACPDSTWSGWTSGSWKTDAPWTTWGGCQASTTATSVYTSTWTASNGTVEKVTTTGFGIQVAQATGNTNAAAGLSTIGGGSNMALAASAVAAFGVLAGAVLL